MKFQFVKSNDKEEVVVYGKEKNDLILSIEKMCNVDDYNLIGYDEGYICKLNPIYIECFFTEDDKIYALENGNKYLVKKRLYELHLLYKENFIYINQGCLANVNLIERFDASISGALIVIFKSGYKEYASRRQIKSIKERIGVRK